MSLDTLTSGAPVDGHLHRPIASGRYGVVDQVRQQQVMTVGMAVSWEDSADPAKRLNTWLYGDSHARPELAGVVATEGNSPTLQIPVSTTNADTSALIFAGYTPVLLAPGEVVRHGQYLEPISGGAYQAHWRVAASGRGPARARQSLDNSAESATAQLISADLLVESASDIGSGLVGVVGPSAALSGVTVETAYDQTVEIPAYTGRVGSIFRIRGAILSNNLAQGANTAKVYFNGMVAGAILATAPATTYASGAVVSFLIDVYIAALTGANNLSLTGSIAAGTPGTATHVAIPGQATATLSSANVVTVTNTPSNAADQSTLLFLSVEHIGA